jgi:hypothetical protein
MQKQIVIAQRGWVFIGYVTTQNNYVHMTDAYCIRRWGTSKGLGEIAQHGPTPNTILDEIGTLRLHELSVVAIIVCKEKK